MTILDLLLGIIALNVFMIMVLCTTEEEETNRED